MRDHIGLLGRVFPEFQIQLSTVIDLVHDPPPYLTGSSLLPPCRGLLLAFTNTVALSFDGGNIGVMEQPVQKRGDATGVGKDLAPIFESPIGRKDDRAALIAAVDKFVEEMGGLVVEERSPTSSMHRT